MIKQFLILIFFAITVKAQNLDSLYNKLLNSSLNSKQIYSTVQIEETSSEKCGFGLRAIINNHFNEFDVSKQKKISEIFSRPILAKSIVSPDGIFRIHFDESGINKPGYSVLELAVAFDSSYNYEVNILGYPLPPSDDNEGGDELYDVYVINTSYYGYTEPENSSGDGTYSSYIVLDNDFGAGFNTHGIEAAKATAAHEFHHAIQLGNFGLRYDDDIFYYELTSTSMEEFVFDEVNDYYSYMDSYFREPSRRFTRTKANSVDGYDLAIWNLFLKQKFEDSTPNKGDIIVKNSWELIGEKKQRAIVALTNSIQNNGESFPQLFNEFGVWMFFTDERTKSNEFFEEAEFYPLIKETSVLALDPEKMPVMFNSEPTSINYLSFYDNSQGLPDTIVTVMSNSDIEGSLIENSSLNIDFTINTNSFSGSTSLNDYYFVKLSGTNSNYIYDSYIINNELASDFKERSTVDFVYPQPFNYELNNMIFIPTFTDISGKAELFIYSIDMNLIYSGVEPISNSDKIVVRWNGFTNDNEKLTSGVYIFATRANGKIKKGKFVVIN